MQYNTGRTVRNKNKNKLQEHAMRINTTTSVAKHLFGPAEGYKKIAESGFQGVDYSETCSAYKPFEGIYAAPDSEFDAYFLREYQYLAEAGLYVNQTHAPFPTYPDIRQGTGREEEFRFMTRAIKKAIRATEILQGKYIVIHCAMRCGWSKDDNPELTREMNRRVFSELLPAAHESGVIIALENMPCAGIPTAYPDQLTDYIDMMGDPEYFTACLDTGHANITGIDAGKYVRALGSRLTALHIHDNDGKQDMHTCPYTGSINWDSFFTALKETGYKGTLSLEANSFTSRFPKELYVRAEAFLKSTLEGTVGSL